MHAIVAVQAQTPVDAPVGAVTDLMRWFYNKGPIQPQDEQGGKSVTHRPLSKEKYELFLAKNTLGPDGTQLTSMKSIADKHDDDFKDFARDTGEADDLVRPAGCGGACRLGCGSGAHDVGLVPMNTRLKQRAIAAIKQYGGHSACSNL